MVEASTCWVCEISCPLPPPQLEQPQPPSQYSLSETNTMLLPGLQVRLLLDELLDDEDDVEQPVGSSSVAPESFVPT